MKTFRTGPLGLLAMGSLVALAGCQTLDFAAGDAFVQKNLPSICSASDTVYAGYVAVSFVKPPSEKTADRVQTATAVLDRLCADPERATTASVLANALNAYLAIKSARDEARA